MAGIFDGSHAFFQGPKGKGYKAGAGTGRAGSPLLEGAGE